MDLDLKDILDGVLTASLETMLGDTTMKNLDIALIRRVSTNTIVFAAFDCAEGHGHALQKALDIIQSAAERNVCPAHDLEVSILTLSPTGSDSQRMELKNVLSGPREHFAPKSNQGLS